MTSLRRIRKGLRNLEEDLDRLEGQKAAGGIGPILRLRLDDSGERYESVETGVAFVRAEELYPEDEPPYWPRVTLFLPADLRRGEAERLAPLFGEPGDVEPMDGETWALLSKAKAKRNPWKPDEDDQDGGRRVDGGPEPDDDPEPVSGHPRPRHRRARKDISVDFGVGSRWV